MACLRLIDVKHAYSATAKIDFYFGLCFWFNIIGIGSLALNSKSHLFYAHSCVMTCNSFFIFIIRKLP